MSVTTPQLGPGGYARAFQSAAAASAAIEHILRLHDPRYHGIYTNFLGDALPSEWAGAATNGTSAAVTVATSQLTLTTGTDDDGSAGQAYGLFFKGDEGFYFESQQSLDVITTAKMEIGITDATGDAGAVATKATPTGTADDFCVLVFDTDDNTELDLISELDDGGPAANAEDVFTLVAATDFKTRFVAQNDVVAVFVNDDNVGSGSMQGGDLVTPWWFVQSRAISSSRIMTIDWAVFYGPTGVALT